MAQQLRSRGKEVALLILFDTDNPDYIRSFRGWKNYTIRLYFKLEKAVYHLRKMRGMPLRKAWRYFWERMRRFQLEPIPGREKPGAPGEDWSEKDLVDAWKVQYLVTGDYEPEPCDWPVVLVRSQVLQTGWFRDPQLGWAKVARGGLQVVEMPGEHDAMFLEPDVQRLGSTLNQCLQKAMAADALKACEAVPA
jgi:thioesterase domain-containing protein